MSFAIGLDVGGTKIAGAVFSDDGQEISRVILPTPHTYSAFVTTCEKIVAQLDKDCGSKASVGVGIPGAIDQKTGIIPVATNTSCLNGQPLRPDLQRVLGRPVKMANDADCTALSEARDGAVTGHDMVFGLIMGTGVGGGFIFKGQIVEGPNGLTGEFGHVPLPYRETVDGGFAPCVCGQKGCIDKSISGPALSRLYESMTDKKADAGQITVLACKGDKDAIRVLDIFYTVVAKAMSAVIHTFDPEIIVVGGGLNDLPALYETVPKRWAKYVLGASVKTKFVPAKHGAMSGLRGAAWVGRDATSK